MTQTSDASRREIAKLYLPVIASAAKQSIFPLCRAMDCFHLRSSSYGGQVASLAMTVNVAGV
jgi:hypothetical protein